MGNDNAPHRAVLYVQAELHERLKTGECSGSPVMKVERFALAIDGADRFIAERKLNELIQELRERCRPNQ